MRAIAIDLGSKRIGIALSDPTGTLASPLTTVLRSEEGETIKAIIEIADKYQANVIVVGLPLMLRGERGIEANKAQDFVGRLSQHTDRKIVTWDERLSTVAAERLMREAGVGWQKRREKQDAVAAALFLQDYLDYLKSHD